MRIPGSAEKRSAQPFFVPSYLTLFCSFFPCVFDPPHTVSRTTPAHTRAYTAHTRARVRARERPFSQVLSRRTAVFQERLWEDASFLRVSVWENAGSPSRGCARKPFNPKVLCSETFQSQGTMASNICRQTLQNPFVAQGMPPKGSTSRSWCGVTLSARTKPAGAAHPAPSRCAGTPKRPEHPTRLIKSREPLSPASPQA